MMAGMDHIGIGLVYHDRTGGILATCEKKLYGNFSVEDTELLALRDGLQLAANWGVEVAVVET